MHRSIERARIRHQAVPNAWITPDDLTTFHTFIAFLELARREQQFWCVNCKKIPNIDGENKYLVFVSDHQARAKTLMFADSS